MAPTRYQLPSLLLLVGLLGSFSPKVRAQGTDAVCSASTDWMLNSRGQNPCLVTAYLLGPCLDTPSDAFVNQLDTPGSHYNPPTLTSANQCRCSTVYYSLLQGCAVCQDHPSIPWSTWSSNCTSGVTVGSYPRPVPVGTTIPPWSLLDVTKSDNFDPVAAKAAADAQPPSSSSSSSVTTISELTTGTTATATRVQTTVTTVGGSTTGRSAGRPGTGTGTSTSTRSTDDTTSFPVIGNTLINTGAIVGGVVGGIGGLAILAGLVFFFLRQSRRSYPSAQYGGVAYGPTGGTDPSQYAPGVTFGGGEGMKMAHDASVVHSPTLAYDTMGQTPPPHGAGSYHGNSTPSSGLLYDPNDPRTFPTPSPGMPYHPPTSPGAYQQPYTPPPGQYQGVAEV